MLPTILKDFMLFLNGIDYKGQISQLTPPVLEVSTSDYRGGGMSGSVKIPRGITAGDFVWQPAGLIPELFDRFGSPQIDDEQLRFAGAYQKESGAFSSVEIYIRGKHTSLGLGDYQAGGENNSPSITTAITYYRLEIDGAEKIEIDFIRDVLITGGIDRNEERHIALGLK